MATVGFIGLGRMGRHMARNLIKAGHTVYLYNRSQVVVDELVAAGGIRAGSPAELAANVSVVFACLTTPQVVEAVLGEAIGNAKPGTIFVDHSTVGVEDARRMAARAAERDCPFIDAPVSGGPWGAEAGTLTIMCGGDPAAYAQVEPLLKAMGQKLYLLGAVGAGAVAKLCNNLLVGIHSAALAEAFVLGTKAGIDPQVLFEIIAGATGGSKQIDRNIPKFIFPGQFDAAFSIDHLHKDVALAVELGKSERVRMLLGAMTQQVLEEARALGFGEQDIAAVIRPLEEQTGTKVRA
ncbi:MAG TPA: NAD(P)-dependent oxidoreductase [Symbiobacteriaceae bacterium]|nr:NAD(P)-dependent oxidoreductase [Symbiobacteriaceae bacterium]